MVSITAGIWVKLTKITASARSIQRIAIVGTSQVETLATLLIPPKTISAARTVRMTAKTIANSEPNAVWSALDAWFA